MRSDVFSTTAFRLSVGYTLIVMLAVGTTLGSAYLLTQSLLTDEGDLIIAAELKGLEEKYAMTGISGLTDEITLKIDSWGRVGAVYMLVDPDFEKIAGNVTHWPFDGLPRESWSEFEIETIEPGRRAVHPVRAAVRSLPGGDKLLVGTDISQGRRFADKFRVATLRGIGLTILAAAMAAFWFSYRLARRVGDVTETCKRIMEGDLGSRLPVVGARDEFDSMAISVNGVLDRLEDQTRTLRATFDSAAHDLRAPLHRLRTKMDALLLRTPALEPAVHESVESALRDVDRLQRTLATLLQIALAESGTSGAVPSEVDLGQLADELVELFEPVARGAGLALTCSQQPGCVLRGNRQLLAQLLTNLLENGIKYVPSGGRIGVTVRQAFGRIVLEVSDNGPGISPEDRVRAVRPFVRLNHAADGSSGLGLSLVSAIARLHRARFALESNEPGLRVVVDLPRDAIPGPAAAA